MRFKATIAVVGDLNALADSLMGLNQDCVKTIGFRQEFKVAYKSEPRSSGSAVFNGDLHINGQLVEMSGIRARSDEF